MGEFFKGWRRKVGLIVIAANLLLTAVWFRGYATVDEINIRSIITRHCLSTSGGRLRFSRVTGKKGAFPRYETADWLDHFSGSYTQKARVDAPRKVRVGKIETYSGQLPDLLMIRCRDDVRWHFLGADFLQGEWWDCGGPFDLGPPSPNENRFFELDGPYWCIVLPLNVLSAYLLLVKPRVAKPKIDSLS